MPSNPVHHCIYPMEDDYTEWSYVYFGSYPQTQVTGDELLEIQYVNYDENYDLVVNGTKYHRVSSTHFYKWEPIKWRVLWNDGSTLFVVADQGLDFQPYVTSTNLSWETCGLRTWLNEDFYRKAFDSSEQAAIIPRTTGNDIQDNISLLSAGEATDPAYGFCENGEESSLSRCMKASDYANNDSYSSSWEYALDGNAYCIWPLRQQGSGQEENGIVRDCGKTVVLEEDSISGAYIVVPALQIDINSDCWTLAADDGADGEESSAASPANPVHHCTHQIEDGTDWSYVYFGSYPQTEITGDALTEEITAASYDEEGDAWINGTMYRRVTSSDANNDYNFEKDGYRYFKWERIKWRVLCNNGSTLFVAADTGLDCKNYHDKQTAVTWETCTLRTWLNETFYQTAFCSSEQKAIVQQTVVNEDNPESQTEGGNDTQDHIYLLSLDDVKNPEYGFCQESGAGSPSRRIVASDYANRMGSYMDDDTGNCMWWLRSPGYDTACAASVRYDMIYPNVIYKNEPGLDVNFSESAVVPALQIRLSSGHWTMEDDGTNGGKPLAELKKQLQSALDVYKDASDYREEQQTELAEAIAAGKAAIEAAEGQSAAEHALDTAKETLDQIKTEEQLTAEEAAVFYKVQEEGKEELEQYKNLSDYREAQKKELEAILTAAKAAIESAEDADAVQRTLNTAKAAMDRIKTNARLTEEEKNSGITLKATAIKGKIRAKSKGFLVKWEKEASVTGYQIQYSTSKKFTKKTTKTKTVKKASKTKLTVKKLKGNKKYYVRIRTYRIVEGKEYDSAWSKAKSVKTKK